jgi:putative two-component system response regulator
MPPGVASPNPAEAPQAAVRRRVLVVDDRDDARLIQARILANLGYDVEQARDGLEALAKLELDTDLVLLDAEMPGMDGFEVAKRIRDNPRLVDLPIMMVTGLGGQEDRLRAVQAGVNDFISKPFEINELRLRTEGLLKFKDASDALKRQQADLERTVQRRTEALRHALEEMATAQRRTYDAHLDTIRRLVIAAEFKDRDTAAHIERIGRYSEVVARALKLAPGQVETLRHATPMHDVGKIGIPDTILLKPGKLTPEEWAIMQQHTIMGARILHGSPSELLQAGEEIALSHHEKWDGSGYPHGLRGEAIPLGGRVCAVADVFDALTSNRHYRDALPNETVFGMIETQAGHHFDPAVVAAFLASRDEVERIQRETRDPAAPSTES